MSKAAVIVFMEVDEETYDGHPAGPIAEIVDAIREVLGTERENVALYAAIRDRAEEIQTICEEWNP